MTSYEVDQIILSSVLALVIGGYATISGWLIFREPKVHIPFQNRLRSMIFSTPKETLVESNRRHGIARIAGGILFLIGGILQIIGLIIL
jgi:hypothetical protein